ncbi:hypothetical protein DENSPDRAFT_838425 [Dentipellis sp. KUC8613]|nr:hypothetical protein DENSPDRAFT_838425 [Dentipellis sp. KUC8613]
MERAKPNNSAWRRNPGPFQPLRPTIKPPAHPTPPETAPPPLSSRPRTEELELGSGATIQSRKDQANNVRRKPYVGGPRSMHCVDQAHCRASAPTWRTWRACRTRTSQRVARRRDRGPESRRKRSAGMRMGPSAAWRQASELDKNVRTRS